MIWQALRTLMVQRGLRLALGSSVSIFIGYALPISLFGLQVSAIDELLLACAMDFELLAALVQWDLHGAVRALGQPLVRAPIWLALGRYMLACGVAGGMLILLALLTTLPGRIRTAWHGWRQRPASEPSEAKFEDPKDAERRMGRRK